MPDLSVLQKARRLKQRWRQGEPTFGAWHAIGSPMVTEIMGACGYDWLFIDLEHTAIDLGTLQTMLAALEASATVPIVRVPGSDPHHIKRVLDIGAAGILVPNVLTAQQASEVVRATKYPPAGIRGWGPWRASSYFAGAAKYAECANDDLIVMIQIEDIKALPELDAIVTTPGLDAVCSGPADLAFSIGSTPFANHPAVADALSQIFGAARRHGVPAAHGLAVSDSEVASMVSQGVTILPLGSDVGLLSQGGKQSVNAAAGWRSTGEPTKEVVAKSGSY
ncbi:aldolase/citrate lyase family protein [Rhizobium sp. AN80A]|uniref:HpcH/HpaI aldolase family protein n=1 Tax=Rhizobium sp. AN80A TaxID=3040673 RepID=UPI0024B3BAA5|nr:aldolase/citrate lyase family protein [Rhizobium sp. AN80A]